MLPNLRDDKSNFDYVLIDGDLLVFAICAAIEYGKEDGEFELSQVTKVIDKRSLRYLHPTNSLIFVGLCHTP